MLRSDRALLGANTSVVDRLERDYRLVDEAHAASAGPLLAAELATTWKIAVVDEAGEPRPEAALRGGVATELVAAAPKLVRTLAPVWLASPYEVPSIPESPLFDVVIVADAAALCLAEAAPALRRARQVVVFGDPVTQRPTAFRVGAGHASAEDEPDVPFDEVSVFERLTELVPVETLTRSYRAGGEDLAELVNGAFYEGRLVSYPWAGSYLGRGSLSVDYVEGGTGAPDPITGAVESPDAEVARVVTLVVEHAVNRPTETLMVVTASVRHAERVRAAVAAAFAGADVAEFVGRDTAEPFAVLGLEESVAESRDRVVFSLGFGLTKHGRVLSDFGDLSGPDGERLLTVGMTRARRSMVIVSSIRPSAFDEGRLESGAATLMSILGGIAARARESRLEDLADPLTLALAGHLRALGIAVDVNYRGILPLVAQHRGKAVVVESDADSMGRPCVRACACARRCCAASAGTTCACTPSTCTATRPGRGTDRGDPRRLARDAARRDRDRAARSALIAVADESRQRVERVRGSRRARLTPAPGTDPRPRCPSSATMPRPSRGRGIGAER
jgi:hypothetical protein